MVALDRVKFLFLKLEACLEKITPKSHRRIANYLALPRNNFHGVLMLPVYQNLPKKGLSTIKNFPCSLTQAKD